MGCCDCCSRTAWGSIFAFLIAAAGLSVTCYFGLESIYSTLELFKATPVEGEGTYSSGIEAVEYALYSVTGFVGAIALVSLIIGGVATCVIGGRSCGTAGRCMGRILIAIFTVILYMLCLCWIVVALVIVAPVIFSIMINVFCKVEPVDSIVNECIDLAQFGLVKRIADNQGVNDTKICFEDLQVFCEQTDTVFINYIVTLAGIVVIILGLIHFLMCMSANYAHFSHGRKKKRSKADMKDVGHNGPQEANAENHELKSKYF
ncbi:neuronal membrane glycoprotein M6-a-like [Ptychodera flava]|uniref:neuronal membrane glycoprotein M6-a-like n=1 Tax=Ptychodera flava TaxID=63121 RepID=UPI003969F25A